MKFKEKYSQYICLMLGGILCMFYNGRYIIPFISWIAPIFLIRFYRTYRIRKGILLSYLTFMVSTFIAFKGVTYLHGILEYIVLAGMALILYIPFFIDWSIGKHFKGWKATLILPLAGTAVEYLFTSVSPYATFGSIAYTQYGNLPIMQLAAVTGIWGISFLLYWTYSFVNYVWENIEKLKAIKREALTIACIFLFVLFAGGVRSTLFINKSPTVRIASISQAHTDMFLEIYNNMFVKDGLWFGKSASEQYRQEIKDKFQKHNDRFLALTESEAKNGSKIIFWNEIGAFVLKEDEKAFLDKVSDTARKNGVYIMASLNTYTPGEKLRENKVVFYDRQGILKFSYLKSRPVNVTGENVVKGNDIIPFVDTEYGRIGSVICYDMDYPSLIRQAGRKNIDIMLVPGWDWKALDPLHPRMSAFRAVENGFNLVRQSEGSVSLSVDYYGNQISALDFYNTKDKVMISQLPTKGANTVYPYLGDVLPWICIVLLVCFYCKVYLIRTNKLEKENSKDV